jgi:hypothetical protein
MAQSKVNNPKTTVAAWEKFTNMSVSIGQPFCEAIGIDTPKTQKGLKVLEINKNCSLNAGLGRLPAFLFQAAPWLFFRGVRGYRVVSFAAVQFINKAMVHVAVFSLVRTHGDDDVA